MNDNIQIVAQLPKFKLWNKHNQEVENFIMEKGIDEYFLVMLILQNCEIS